MTALQRIHNILQPLQHAVGRDLELRSKASIFKCLVKKNKTLDCFNESKNLKSEITFSEHNNINFHLLTSWSS